MKQLERIHRKLAATPQLSSVLTICGLLLVVFASMCVYSESYRSAYNVTNVLVQCVPLACVSLGQTLVIISGGIDLSVGSTISVCTAIAARLMGSDNPAQVLLGVVVVFAFAAGVGLVNGAGVTALYSYNVCVGLSRIARSVFNCESLAYVKTCGKSIVTVDDC